MTQMGDQIQPAGNQLTATCPTCQQTVTLLGWAAPAHETTDDQIRSIYERTWEPGLTRVELSCGHDAPFETLAAQGNPST